MVLALVGLLDALGMPRHRAVLYAWNPLAVFEVAGSGHVEPLGMALVLLALIGLTRDRKTAAGAALGGAIQAKLLPLLLVPGFVRRAKAPAIVAMLAVIALTTAPYALRGPWFGAGVVAYAHRWEHGAVLFAGVRRFVTWVDLAPHAKGAIAWAQARWGSADTAWWDAAQRLVWPQETARLAVAVAAFGWAIAQSFRPRIDAAHEARLVFGGALLLAPTLHPWYVLWVLPLAACHAAGGWLIFGALVPLQYLAGAGDVPWPIRLAILLPALAWMTKDALLRFRR